MRAFTGIWMPGMMPKMLHTKTKVNTVTRNGRKRMPSGPIPCRITSLRTKSMTASATFCTPFGTSPVVAFRAPR